MGRLPLPMTSAPKYLGRPCKKDPTHILGEKSHRYVSNHACVRCSFARMTKKRKISRITKKEKVIEDGTYMGKGIYLLDEERKA